MPATQSKVTSKGQIVIPKAIRARYGIKASTTIRWIEKSGGILIVPDMEDPVIAARGMFKRTGLLQKLLEERRRERERELDKTNG